MPINTADRAIELTQRAYRTNEIVCDTYSHELAAELMRRGTDHADMGDWVEFWSEYDSDDGVEIAWRVDLYLESEVAS